MTRPYQRELDLLTAVLLAAAVFSTLYPAAFLSAANARAVLNNLAFDGILAVGMMLLMVAGVFDLSVGAMASLAGVVCGYLLVSLGWPVPAAVVAALLVAASGGLANGLLVARAWVNALIATLGTMGIFQGVAVLVGGPGVSNLPAGFTQLGQTEFPGAVFTTPDGPPVRVGVQLPVWVMLVLAAVGHYLLQHTAPFRRYYYIGANPKAAHLSGIDVSGLQVLGFTLIAAFRGFREVVEKAGCTCLEPVQDKGNQAEAARVAAGLLQAHPDLVGMAGFDSESGPGMGQAIKEAGKAGQLVATCVEAEPQHLRLLKAGILTACVGQKRELFTYLGVKVLHEYRTSPVRFTADDRAAGVSPVAVNYNTGTYTVTAKNVDLFLKG